MLICEIQDQNVCWLSFAFGLASFLYLSTSVLLLIKYRSNEERKLLILFSILSTVMTFHYFLVSDSFDVLYFLKEYFLIITLAYICYYFLSQMHNLIQGHVFLTYFGLVSIILTVIYITTMGLYFTVKFFLVSDIFKCSNSYWLLLKITGIVLSVLFSATGMYIHKVLDSIDIIYRAETKKKEWELWYELFRKIIGLCVVGSCVGFVENVVYVVDDDSSCFIMVSENSEIDITMFIFLRMVTDYMLMSFILVQFVVKKLNEKVSFISTVNEDKLEILAEREYTHSSIFN